MNPSLTRRRFVHSAGLTVLAAAALPGAFAQTDHKTVVALVGCAHIHTPSFVKLLNSRADVTVKWVWDHDASRAEKNAAQVGARATADLTDIWNDPQVRAVVVCSETNLHLDLVLAGAKAGKHMFAEKPLGITAADSDRMADAIASAGLLFTTGYFMRTDPKHLFIKEQIAKGRFGKITRVRGSCCHAGALEGWFDDDWRWMADPKQAGVGAFGDLGTHKLDILMWLMGDVASVTADIKVVVGRYPGCDESGEALIRFANGATGTLAAGWVAVDDPVTLMVSGTEGHATVFKDQLYFKSKHVAGATGTEPWKQLPAELPLPLNQFIDAVGGKTDQPLVTVREAAARVRVMEAMYEAAREHKWVKLA
jgi:predicted dehydrogenase